MVLLLSVGRESFFPHPFVIRSPLGGAASFPSADSLTPAAFNFVSFGAPARLFSPDAWGAPAPSGRIEMIRSLRGSHPLGPPRGEGERWGGGSEPKEGRVPELETFLSGP